MELLCESSSLLFSPLSEPTPKKNCGGGFIAFPNIKERRKGRGENEKKGRGERECCAAAFSLLFLASIKEEEEEEAVATYCRFPLKIKVVAGGRRKSLEFFDKHSTVLMTCYLVCQKYVGSCDPNIALHILLSLKNSSKKLLKYVFETERNKYVSVFSLMLLNRNNSKIMFVVR